MRPRRALLVIAVGILAAACGGGGDASPSPSGHGMPSVGMGTVPPTVVAESGCTQLDGGRVTVVAEGLAFDTDCIAAPAGWGFVIVFENRDGAPHNIVIEDAAGATVFDGQNATGETVGYTIPPLDAGEYVFHCHVHPDMRGVIRVS